MQQSLQNSPPQHPTGSGDLDDPTQWNDFKNYTDPDQEEDEGASSPVVTAADDSPLSSESDQDQYEEEDVFGSLAMEEEADSPTEDVVGDSFVPPLNTTLHATFSAESLQIIQRLHFDLSSQDHFKKLQPLKIIYESEWLDKPMILLAWPVLNAQGEISINVIPYLQHFN
ncbi:MAG: hypothetical protein WBA23_09205 [Tunicatimonas sp.]|uniref:hypothetical protein n=1 Tax=Tunicatimonas sp. TaxID=1940096 RepID=UPI003C763B26